MQAPSDFQSLPLFGPMGNRSDLSQGIGRWVEPRAQIRESRTFLFAFRWRDGEGEWIILSAKNITEQLHRPEEVLTHERLVWDFLVFRHFS